MTAFDLCVFDIAHDMPFKVFDSASIDLLVPILARAKTHETTRSLVLTGFVLGQSWFVANSTRYQFAVFNLLINDLVQSRCCYG